MIKSKQVHFYWGGPLLFGPPNAYFWGDPDPPDPLGIDAPARGAAFYFCVACSNCLQNNFIIVPFFNSLVFQGTVIIYCKMFFVGWP